MGDEQIAQSMLQAQPLTESRVFKGAAAFNEQTSEDDVFSRPGFSDQNAAPKSFQPTSYNQENVRSRPLEPSPFDPSINYADTPEYGSIWNAILGKKEQSGEIFKANPTAIDNQLYFSDTDSLDSFSNESRSITPPLTMDNSSISDSSSIKTTITEEDVLPEWD